MLAAFCFLFVGILAVANEPALPRIGAAPAFKLTTHDNAELALAHLRGKVVAVTFLFTTCQDTCPALTAKLVNVERKLTAAGEKGVTFVAISLMPQHDTPEVLRQYGKAQGVDFSRWAFLTGDTKQIHALAQQYGVYVRAKKAEDEVDHGFLTSLIDRNGFIRVQYMGTRFEPNEMLADLRALARE
jgi:protein SCO1/2